MEWANPTWTLSLTDGVSLSDPNGNSVVFPYRQVGDLFARLANAGSHGLDRDHLAAMLWPSVDVSARRLNLRQTLSRLRKAIGSDVLATTRNHCRLAEGFPVTIVGRSESSDGARSDFAPTTPMGGFLRMFDWYQQNDPRRMLEFMKASFEFTLSMPADVRGAALETIAPKIPHTTPLRAWLPFWRGYTLLSHGPIADVREHFSLSAAQAEADRDGLLVSECYFWWGAMEILLGNSTKALRLADKAESILSACGSKDRFHKIHNLRGTVYLHLNRPQEALEIFERTTGYSNLSTVDFANHEVLRAFYFATLGDAKGCRNVLEFPLRLASESGMSHLDSLSQLATGVMEVQEAPSKAVTTLETCIQTAKRRKSAHYELYAHEALAVAQLRLKNIEQTRLALGHAKRIRTHLGMTYTGWDLKRLQPLVGNQAR